MSATAVPPGTEAVIALRRYTNAEIARIATRFDEDEGNGFIFVCECGDPVCDERVSMALTEFLASTPGSVVGHAPS